MALENEVIGNGFGFPLSPASDGKLRFQGKAEKIRQNIWLILSTAPGERVMLPEFGCGIYDLVFEANTASLRSLVQSQVSKALVRWEPRIDLLDVRVDVGTDHRVGGASNNQILIYIDYLVRANNSIYNLVYPFFINEGAG